MRLRKFNDEVFFASGPEVRLNRRDLALFQKMARKSPRRRWRLCAHPGESAPVHEMLICLPRSAYVRPHKHRSNPESYHVIRGSAILFLFDERGRETSRVPLGDSRSGRCFYYKLEKHRFHTLLVLSDYLVFMETKSGPFKRSDSVPAPWATPETDRAGGRAFLRRLKALAGKRR